MGKIRWGRAVLASLLMGAAMTTIAATVAGAAFIPATVSRFSGSTVAFFAGSVLAALGIATGLSAMRPDEGPVPSVPAHLSFVKRQEQPLHIPDTVKPKPRTGPAAELAELDERIRDLTRKINRAGVMLATGKLSSEGYAKYVEQLKGQRGAIEAERVKKGFRAQPPP